MAIRTVTVNSVAATEIRARTVCSKIVVGEDASTASFPTTDLLISKPPYPDIQRRIPGGAEYPFTRRESSFGPGLSELAGYVQTVSGSITLFIDEGD